MIRPEDAADGSPHNDITPKKTKNNDDYQEVMKNGYRKDHSDFRRN